MFIPTVKLPLKYKLKIHEDVRDLTRWMTLRSQYFIFHIDNFNDIHWHETKSGDRVRAIERATFTIPSAVEGERIDEDASELYLKLLGTDLLKKVERRIKAHLESEWISKGLGQSPKWDINWIREEESKL